MSIYNDICRRMHLPRELEIRRIMSETGVDLSLYGPSSEEDLGENPGEEEYLGEEQGESENEEVEDPCPSTAFCLVLLNGFTINFFFSMGVPN